MESCPFFATLSRWMDEPESPVLTEEIRSHLKDCRSCRTEYGALLLLEEGLEGEGEPERVSCPSEEELGEYAEIGSGRDVRLSRHLAGCVSCREAWKTLRRNVESAATVDRGTTFRFPRRMALLAASLLMAGGVLSFVMLHSSGLSDFFPGHSSLPDGVVEVQEVVPYRLGTGSELVLLEGTRLESAAGDAGGRRRLILREGGVRFSGNGRMRLEVLVPGGVVRDIGTRFELRLRETTLPWRDGNRTVRFSIVQVEEGLVEMKSGGGGIQVRPARRGYLMEEGDLFLEIASDAATGVDFLEHLRSLSQERERGTWKSFSRIWLMMLERYAGEERALMSALNEPGLPDGSKEMGLHFLKEVEEERK